MLLRRTFLAGLFSAFAAPAIVRASSLMPISPLLVPEKQLIIERTRVLGPPRCSVCFNAWGMCSGCAADIDHDGKVNVNDLLLVINRWK